MAILTLEDVDVVEDRGAEQDKESFPIVKNGTVEGVILLIGSDEWGFETIRSIKDEGTSGVILSKGPGTELFTESDAEEGVLVTYCIIICKITYNDYATDLRISMDVQTNLGYY